MIKNKEDIIMNKIKLASYIDHTILKPDATEGELIKLCEEAKEHQFFLGYKWLFFYNQNYQKQL